MIICRSPLLFPPPHFDKQATIMFAKLDGFDYLSQLVLPEEYVGLLDTLFRRMDQLCREHGVEKVGQPVAGDLGWWLVVAGGEVMCW